MSNAIKCFCGKNLLGKEMRWSVVVNSYRLNWAIVVEGEF